MAKHELKVVAIASLLAGAGLGLMQPVQAANQQGWQSVNYNDSEMVTGSGNIVSQQRQVGGFESISIKGATDVTIRQGSATSLTIQTDDNILDRIGTDVEDGVLVFDSKGSYRTRYGVKATLVVPSLEGVHIMGSGDVKFEDWSGERLDLHVQGSGDIDVEGRVGEVTAHVQGSGDIDLTRASVGRVDAHVQGSGDVDAGSPQRLAAMVHGSGDIRYSGSPQVERQSVHGSGHINSY